MSTPKKTARLYLITGNHFPFDANDAWWNTDMTRVVPPAKDWAHKAARGILAKLRDQNDIAIGDVDEAARAEIVKSIADIIREARNDDDARAQVRHE